MPVGVREEKTVKVIAMVHRVVQRSASNGEDWFLFALIVGGDRKSKMAADEGIGRISAQTLSLLASVEAEKQ
jgi:hypothetical protein